jgi:hypothetical protein
LDKGKNWARGRGIVITASSSLVTAHEQTTLAPLKNSKMIQRFKRSQTALKKHGP